ncbi:Imm64 family immunity protein [Methanolobus sp. WCC1]|uniref:Imm64 family immunity protein n=1 Tax=unclassified Methanolobus TaxID=2629569 RepID=UPI00324852AB
MGARISIGLTYGIGNLKTLVYDDATVEKLQQELKNIIEYFLDSNGTIKVAKYSENADGENWKEINLDSLFFSLENLKDFSSGYYGEILLNSEIIKGKKLDYTIRTVKETNFFGFLLDIEEADIFKSTSYPDEEIDSITEKLITTMCRIYSHSKYDYAFCDLEAQFYYPLEIFKHSDGYIYSVTIIPNSDSNLTVIKSDWHIDGHNARKKTDKYILYSY